jgi:hypothetical protein
MILGHSQKPPLPIYLCDVRNRLPWRAKFSALALDLFCVNHIPLDPSICRALAERGERLRAVEYFEAWRRGP